MEYAGALGTIIFNKSCRLHDLTEVQVGRNQFTMDVVVDQLDGEVDHTAERISALEDKMADVDRGLDGLLALGQEQTKMSTQSAQGLGQLAMAVLAQQAKIRSMEECMDAMREMILGLEHMAANPILVDDETAVVGSELGEELEVEENEVAIPVLIPGRLVPIEDEVQVLPDELVGTQITFKLADEDCLLGSAILPPSCVPERNPIVPYVVRPCLSSASVWLPPHSRTYHPVTSFTIITSVHLVASHPSLIPPIFLHVCLIYPDFLWIRVSCVIFPVPPSLYLSLVLCILSSPESTLLLSVLSALT